MQYLFIYLFIYLCFGVSISTVDRVLNSTWVDLITFHLNWTWDVVVVAYYHYWMLELFRQVYYIFVHFIIGYEKKQLSRNRYKKYGCDRLP
jgi:hypothetical protein